VTKIEYNRTLYQTYNQTICGQLCLQFFRTVDVCQFKARQYCPTQYSDSFSIMSLIFSLTGKSNVLATIYFPAIDLSDGDYELGLMNFETYNTIPNVNALNNKFYFDEDDVEITSPEGEFVQTASHK